MEECPKCKKYSVAYDGYHGLKRCYIDGCTTRIINDNSYSILRLNLETKTIDRIVIVKSEENIVNPKVLKSYDML